MSSNSVQDFALYMIKESNFLSERYGDISEWFDLDGNPMPIVLMGDFGISIVKNFSMISDSDWWKLVELIEDGLNSEDKDVDTAVATGLIEAVVNVAELEEGLWPRIDAALGPEARAYAEAYRNAPFMNR